MKHLLLIALSLLFFTGTVWSAPINWDESSDGDLYVDVQSFPPFNLDIGTNTFTGSSYFDLDGKDNDGFTFNISSGQQLESISYELINFDYYDTIPDNYRYATFGYQLNEMISPFEAPTYLNSTGFIDLFSLSETINWFSENMPLDEGMYILSNNLMGRQIDDWWSIDYRISLEVSSASAPVPEPSTILLLGSGLVGLAWYGRKKRGE